MAAQNLQQTPQWFANPNHAQLAANPAYQAQYSRLANQFGNIGPGSQNPSVTNPSQGFILYNGQVMRASDFAQQNPQAWDTLYNSRGGANPIPAGQAGSLFPSALPLNSFEQAINEAKQAMVDANAANEKRYKQALLTNHQQGEMLDSGFAGIGQRYDEGANAIRGTAGQGYDRALADLEGYGSNQINEAKREGSSREAVASSSTRQRGLFNSTVLDAMQRREREQTDRNVNSINESVQGMRSGINLQRAGAMSNIEQGIQSGRTNLDLAALQGRYGRLSERNQIIIGREDSAPDAGDLATLIANREVGQATAQAQKKASKNALLGGILGTVGSLGAAFLSDKRAKKDVRKVRDNKEEPDEYEFRYKDAFVKAGKAPPGKYRGVMAQEMQRKHPEKVRRGYDGLLRLMDRMPRKVA